MALATRCPHCQTVFRIVPDQLKLHRGLVRCGHCREVFDGVLHQVEPPVRPAAPVPPVVPPVPEVVPPVAEVPAEVFPEAHPDSAAGTHDAAAHEAAGQTHDVPAGDSASEAGMAAHESMAEAAAEMAAPAGEVFPEAHTAPAAESTEAPLSEHSADVEQEAHPAAPKHVAEAPHAEPSQDIANEAHSASPEPAEEALHVASSADVASEPHTEETGEVAEEPRSFPVAEQVSDHEAEPVHEAAHEIAGRELERESDAENVEIAQAADAADVAERDFAAHAAEAAEHDARLASDAPPFVAEDPDAQHGPVDQAPLDQPDDYPSVDAAQTHVESPSGDAVREHVEHPSSDAVHEHVEQDGPDGRAEDAEHLAHKDDGQDSVEHVVHEQRLPFGHEQDVIDVEPTTPHYGPTIETDPWVAPPDTRTEPALNLTAPTLAAAAATTAAAAAAPAFAPLADDDRNDFRIRVEPHPEPHGSDLHPARRAIGWIVAALLLVLLVALLAWWQREPIMSRWPQTADMYRQTCAKLGCVVVPPRNIDQLQIETSTLTQSTQANQFDLSMSIHNRAALALAWPSLEISLLDANNQLVIRRVVSPAQYLPAGTDLNAGIGANGRQAVRLQLNASDTAPANYRVLIFYP